VTVSLGGRKNEPKVRHSHKGWNTMLGEFYVAIPPRGCQVKWVFSDVPTGKGIVSFPRENKRFTERSQKAYLERVQGGSADPREEGTRRGERHGGGG